MTGLVLKLAPRERILINGAVIENGDRRGKLNILSPEVNILRLRDAIHPADANTPVTRLCYQVQLVLAGEADLEEVREDIQNHLCSLFEVFPKGPEAEAIRSARRALIEGRTYFVLKNLRTLISVEAALLGDRGIPPSRIPAPGLIPLDNTPNVQP